jgi:CelD/BcsL family acetyltransferase involved in cellulose biosynthesis
MSVTAPGRPLVDLVVTESTGLSQFEALAREWNELVAASSDQIFLRHEFLLLWLQTFAAPSEIRILLGRDPGGRLVAALPLLETPDRVYGIPVRKLAATANAHSCRFDLLALDAARAADAFFAHLVADADWDVLRINELPANGKGLELLRSAREAGLPAGLWESQRSPYLDLPGSSRELDRQLSGQLRSTVRRRRRQLAERGNLTFERFESGDLQAALDECFLLERKSWKGEQGTAALQDRSTKEFYYRLAELALPHGWLSLYRLRLDGRTISFQYGLTYGGTFNLLKLAYDQDLSRSSPGLVLQDDVVRDCLARGLARCDFLGGDELWKRRWSNGVLAHKWLFVYRDTVGGRLLHRAKFEWAPVVRRWLRRGADETA